MALAMTYAGVAGETESEMARVLCFQMPNDQVHEGMRQLRSDWMSPSAEQGIKLNLANRLWGQTGARFLERFLQVSREIYGAELERLNFDEPENAARTINGWIEEQTENRITDLVSANTLSPDTQLVLTNAVYFHGIWSEVFKEENTQVADFHVSAIETVQVQMMHRWDKFRYAATDDLQILELPYGDGSLSMILLLPTDTDGLTDLEPALTPRNIKRWLEKIESKKEVKVYLPKFKTTCEFEMARILKSMGMNSAFDPDTADFSAMTADEGLYISEVIHKAFIDVNEEGTEAAAATAVTMYASAMPLSDPDEPPTFRADHPFVFLIRDNRSGSLLFLGRVKNPLE